MTSRGGLVVVDIGNTRIKWAEAAPGDGPLATLSRRLDVMSREFDPATVQSWFAPLSPHSVRVLLGSVHDAAAERLEGVIASVRGEHPIEVRRVMREHLPIQVDLDAPDRVGIDRLAGAAAAARLAPGQAMVVIDCGTAVTVDLVSAAGVFLGGAILPGPALAARALADGASRLAAVADLDTGAAPVFPGRCTEQAVAAGIGYGIRGGVACLVSEAQRHLGCSPVVFLTGGSAGLVRDAVPEAREIPDLVLQGLALAD